MDSGIGMFILTNLYLTVPQCLAAGLCVVMLMRPGRTGVAWRLLAYTLIFSLFNSITFYYGIEYRLLTPRMVLWIAVDYLLFRWLFDYESPVAQMAALVSAVAVIVSTVAGTLVSLVAGVGFMEFFTMRAAIVAALNWYPCYLLIVLLAWLGREFLQAWIWSWISTLKSFRRARIIFWLLLLQLGLMTGGLMSISSFTTSNFSAARMTLTIFIYGFLFVSTLALCYFSVQMAQQLYKTSIENNLSEQVADLLSTVESQRDGFLNALGELDTLAEEGKRSALAEYLDTIARDLKQVSRRLMAGNTLISAMLNAKLIESEKEGINMEIELESPLGGPFIDRHSLEMIRILGNLLDNALDAARNADPINRWIRVQTRHQGPIQRLTISNPLPADARLSEDIFQPGYTGKIGQHSGLGLYSARRLARELGGNLKFQIEPGPVVSFVLLIPR